MHHEGRHQLVNMLQLFSHETSGAYWSTSSYFIQTPCSRFVQYKSWPTADEIPEEEYGKAMLNEAGQPSFQVAVTFDGRSRNRRHFVSVMLVVKQEGFECHWQAPKQIYTLGEAVGGDDRENLSKEFKDLWKECQDLLDGELLLVPWNDTEFQIHIDITIPADMKAHWSMFGCGGMQGGGGQQPAQATGSSSGTWRERAQVCHRCNVTYKELDRVFTTHYVKVRPTEQKSSHPTTTVTTHHALRCGIVDQSCHAHVLLYHVWQ